MKIDTTASKHLIHVQMGVWIALWMSFVCLQCKGDRAGEGVQYVRFDPISVQEQVDSSKMYAVVENPAGTTVLQALRADNTIRAVDSEPLDFLAFPGNYGFILGSGMVDTVTGMTHRLPVMLLMPALKEGSVVSMVPVALLQLLQDGRPFPVIIGVPGDAELRSIHMRGFVEFITEYDAVQLILKVWFLNYLGRDTFTFVGWRDEHAAMRIIRQWKISE